MPQDNQLSPLFGHISDTPAPETPISPVSDKASNILDGQVPPETAPAHELFAGVTTEPSEAPAQTPNTTPQELPTVSLDAVFGHPAPTLNETPSSVASTPEVLAQEAPPVPAPIASTPEVPLVEEVPNIPIETTPLADAPIPSEDLDRDIPLHILTPRSSEISETPSSSDVHEKKTDDTLARYLASDPVYQDMIHEIDQEKIRLSLAIRYTLLMFAIFLVFAWIVSNRVIMFGFSEFTWLARIRDVLFGIMSGLFALTLWFGSVTWTHHQTLIMVIRTCAVIFFLSVLVALYFPF